MATATRHMTADDFFRMPDDGNHYELVRGELRKMLAAGIFHGVYAARIRDSALPIVYGNALGELPVAETGFVLDYDHVRVPDASFVLGERYDALDENTGFVPGPPDIAVEVISPTDRMAEVEEKTLDYLAAGALVVIVANPRNKTVAIHRSTADAITLTEADTLEVPDLIPGWQLPVADIFRPGRTRLS